MLPPAVGGGLDTAHDFPWAVMPRREEQGFLLVSTALEPGGLGNRCSIPWATRAGSEADPQRFPGSRYRVGLHDYMAERWLRAELAGGHVAGGGG